MKAADAYEKARKLGLQVYRQRIIDRMNPYLPVLDTLIADKKIKKSRPYKLMEIPLNKVIGTKTAGRTEAFASDFMPLLEEGTEFASKWMNVYEAQVTEGLRDPIKAYELFGRYFVEEGNKRVSVLKFCEAASISAEVKEIVIEADDTEGGRLYKAFLEFRESTGVSDIILTREKGYKQLLKLLDLEKDQVMTEDQSLALHSTYTVFENMFEKMGGNMLKITAGDAFLVYLDYYGYQPETIPTPSSMEKELTKIWPDLQLYPKKRETAIIKDTDTSDRRRIFSLRTSPLKVTFIENKTADTSNWTASHIRAINRLKEEMGNDIDVNIIEDVNSEAELIDALEKSIKNGSEVIFTESPEMLRISNQFAAAYPKVKILNCSLNVDTGKLRTYYSRDYEILFLLGMVAGALTQTDHIGYIASYPIYGTAANINAFAVGAAMVNPRAKIYLDWSTTQESLADQFPLDIDIIFIEGQNFDLGSQKAKQFGLFDVSRGKFFNLANIERHWDVFYRKIIKSILNNSWAADEQTSGSDSINYWWGLSNGLIDMTFHKDLPSELVRLVNLVKSSMASDQFAPFEGALDAQDGWHHTRLEDISLQDIAKMDWLCSNVVGRLPSEDQMTEETESIVQLHGLNKVKEDES